VLVPEWLSSGTAKTEQNFTAQQDITKPRHR